MMAEGVETKIDLDASSQDQKSKEQEDGITFDGTVDYIGRPAKRADTGGWRSTPFIFGAEFAEKTAAFGAQFNLVTYLVGKKHLALAYAANMTTNYLGTGYMMALLGGFVADTFLGRFWTTFIAGNFQMLGFIVLCLTAVLPSLNNQECIGGSTTCRAVHGNSLAAIYGGLYLIALGTGGIKACVSAFGADQFDALHPEERKSLPRYFNWFFCAIEMGSLVAATLMIYIQDYQGWGWGFGVLVGIMGTSLLLLFASRSRYRYRVPNGSPLTPIVKVVVAAFRNRKLPHPTNTSSYFYGNEEKELEKLVSRTSSMRFLEKAAIQQLPVPDNHIRNSWQLATMREVEDVKMVIRLLPILASSFFYWTASIQFTTFTVAQLATMDRTMGPHFTVPSGSVGGVFLTFSIITTIVLYDRVIMPLMRHFTGNSLGLTSLQKIGLGLCTPMFAMTSAALVEQRRLRIARSHNAVENFHQVLPLTMFWLIPQYFIIGAGQAFIYVGQLEFFYNECPKTMQSLSTALVSCTLGIGVFTSSAIVSAVNRATKTSSHEGWLGDNLNKGHLDRFFWLLCILSSINLILFLCVSRWHTYRKLTDKDIDNPSPIVEKGKDIDNPSPRR